MPARAGVARLARMDDDARFSKALVVSLVSQNLTPWVDRSFVARKSWSCGCGLQLAFPIRPETLYKYSDIRWTL